VTSWIKYGGSRLRLETVPIPIGGACRAELTLSKRIQAGQAVNCRLQCYMATVRETRSLSATSNDPHIEHPGLGEDEETVTYDGSGTLRIAFAVPEQAPGTRAPSKQFRYFWQLKAEVPGGKGSYHAEFEVPVFKVALTETQVQEAKSVAAARSERG